MALSSGKETYVLTHHVRILEHHVLCSQFLRYPLLDKQALSEDHTFISNRQLLSMSMVSDLQ